MRRCEHIVEAGYEEYRCRLSGVDVDASCADASAGDCLPRIALRISRGYGRVDELPREERAVVARLIKQMGSGWVAMDAAEMSVEQIEQEIERLKALRTQQRAAERRRQSILPRLRERLERLDRERREIIGRIRAIEEGLPDAASDGEARAPRRRWTSDEIKRVEQMRAAGKSYREIGEALGRSWRSVATLASKLEITGAR